MKWNFYHMMDADGGANGGEPVETPKGMTFDEFLKSNPENQREFDRRMTKGLETARGKWQQEADNLVQAARTEAEKLASMNAEEKAEHALKKREEDVQRRDADLTRRELRINAAQMLHERGLPTELLELVSFTDSESCKASIDMLEKVHLVAVQKGVEARMQGVPPKDNTTKPENKTNAMRKALGLS